MTYLHKTRKMTEIGIRFRFLFCHTMQKLISDVLPSCFIYPFGSCVNGFGSQYSDLDLTVQNSNTKIKKSSPFNFIFKQQTVFQPAILNLIKQAMKTKLHSTGDLLYIRHARVPIIKFQFQITNLSCDLSDSLTTQGNMMSELLYLYSKLDYRIAPLVSTIKAWALHKDLTRSTPGHWPSGFMLLMMVIFFFQSHPSPSIPSIQQFLDKNSISSQATFPSLTKLQSIVGTDYNKKTLEELLMEFLKYYSEFNFNKHGLCLFTGQTIKKPAQFNTPMYILNPFEPGHNIAKNVSSIYILNIQEEMKKTLLTVETSGNSGYNWGIMQLLDYSVPQNHIKLELSTLFYNENEDKTSGTIKLT